MASGYVKRTFAEVEIPVPTMCSEESADKILMALELIPGVRDAKARMVRKSVSVRYEPGQVGEQQLKNVLNQAGFAVVAA